MDQFKKYSKYYDALYQNKDYQAEINFVLKALKKHSERGVRSILSLGCGTGTYEIILAKKGYQITGVDLSKEMLEIAKEKAKNSSLVNIDFKYGDVRNFRSEKKYDAAMAMFNIAGYQNTDKDFGEFAKTAASHLKKGGLFIFDAWYKPAVLKDPPENREKIIKIGKEHTISRQTDQKLKPKKNILEITFTVKEIKNGKVINQATEKHPMRFFSSDEIENTLQNNSFKLLKICKFMDLNTPISEDYWDMFVIAKKK